ncbi:hypothetical protein P691DRAFT_654978 [Macrolepiota fuliginosa MF-IS2]|uniref:Uncharacterized protein n=1 Tax=Macrolepiota fuliginosa MF-IS2 TaxID=1400762 RepID=A0A9P5XQ61_9AGAR|nr:hypothetical protein P691DRAFT_654978 [Macrolepiota fuliginosa MF-IS2]
MACTLIPTIQISHAPPQEHFPEPYSPFRNLSFPEPDSDPFRPTLLTPPPTHTTFAKHLSPLCPPDAPVTNKGLERERFEALLRASKERNALVGAKKALDLRKEIAHKAHKNRLVERRALFLSKVLAPPSPTATTTPKTPPESPGIFHYSLPSPGLVSPLALFDTLHDSNESTLHTRHSWVEQVDFRVPDDHKKPISLSAGPPRAHKAALPSLDQISARLKTLASARSTTIVDGLRPPVAVPVTAPSASSNKPATIEIGRLKMPVRAPKPITASLTESNLKILDARERRAHDMLSTLRRRTLTMPSPLPEEAVEMDMDSRKCRWKRHSAPADLMPRERIGFEHPVFALRGAF